MTYRDSNAYDDEGLSGTPSEPRIIITSVRASQADDPPEDALVPATYNPNKLGETFSLSKEIVQGLRTASTTSTADTLRAGYDPYAVWGRLCRD